MAELQLVGVSKAYGTHTVIKDLDLSVQQGEFVSLLGPSGCGKSTTLTMIAGLSRPSDGDIIFKGRPLVSSRSQIFVEPEERDFGMVFQSYALWPHMNVEQNLAFPLKVRRINAVERRKRIEETLQLVGLEGLGTRYPGQLSGGQQQRVGLARALVYRPSLLLLDEPLSNLDALLREQARVWLKDIQTRLGITTVYVTHDQTEALSLSDRIVVMNAGRIEQNASPSDIYGKPASRFVADFVGSANFLSGVVEHNANGLVQVRLGDHQLVSVHTQQPPQAGKSVVLAVRPESFGVEFRGDPSANTLKVNLKRNLYLGERFSYECEMNGVAIKALGSKLLEPGPQVLYFGVKDATIFDDAHPAGKVPVESHRRDHGENV